MHRAVAVVRRDGAARHRDRLQRLATPEQEQDAVAADVIGIEPLVGVDAREPEHLLIERAGAGEIVHIKHGLEHSLQAGHVVFQGLTTGGQHPQYIIYERTPFPERAGDHRCI